MKLVNKKIKAGVNRMYFITGRARNAAIRQVQIPVMKKLFIWRSWRNHIWDEMIDEAVMSGFNEDS